MIIRAGKFKARSAFTLAELVISMAVFTVLMLAMGSSIMISSRALESASAPVSGSPVYADTVSTLSSDFQLAQRLVSVAPGAASFYVPDRDNNGNLEYIEYSWSGTAGDPLYRKVNNGAFLKFAEDVHTFNLSYEERTLTPPLVTTTEHDESIIIFHDNAPGGTMSDYPIVGANWCAQYMKPQIPGNAIRWSIDRIRIYARKDLFPGGSIVVEVREADQRKPVATFLESVTVQESDLPPQTASGVWTTVYFSVLDDLDPKGEYCIVIGSALGSTGTAALIQWESNGSPMTSRTHWMTSNDGGTTWTNQTNNDDMRFYVHGTVTTMTRNDVTINYPGF